MDATMTMKIVRDLADGKLHVWSGGFAERPTDIEDALTAVVFVHGILSSHEYCFRKCYDTLAKNNGSWRFFYVDYDYWTPMEDNGRWLASTLRQHFRDKDNVIIVAHSMGGSFLESPACPRGFPLSEYFSFWQPQITGLSERLLSAYWHTCSEARWESFGVFAQRRKGSSISLVPKK
jgi:hypothetical protein